MQNQSKLLLIDDEDIVLAAVANQLSDLDYNVFTSNNGEDALALLDDTANSFDAVLVDRMMLGIDGLQVLNHIKTTDHLKHLPVIMLTGEAQNEDQITALKAGVFDFIYKPVEPELLSGVLKRALQFE